MIINTRKAYLYKQNYQFCLLFLSFWKWTFSHWWVFLLSKLNPYQIWIARYRHLDNRLGYKSSTLQSIGVGLAPGNPQIYHNEVFAFIFLWSSVTNVWGWITPLCYKLSFSKTRSILRLFVRLITSRNVYEHWNKPKTFARPCSS